MKAGYIQFDVKHSKEENLNLIEKYLCESHFDLAVLPELCNCGYLFESRESLKRVTEEVQSGETVAAITEMSKKYDCTIVFGIAEEDSDKIYNTAVIVSKGKYIGKYRKIHLSDFEKTLFDSGNLNCIFEANGIKIGIQICFDLWFPEISREQIRQGADILCVLANFGGETTYSIAKTRATENLTPLILCNRIGEESLPDIDAFFLGKSSIIDASGKRLSVGKSGTETADFWDIEIVKEKSNVICRNFNEEIEFHYK